MRVVPQSAANTSEGNGVIGDSYELSTNFLTTTNAERFLKNTDLDDCGDRTPFVGATRVTDFLRFGQFGFGGTPALGINFVSRLPDHWRCTLALHLMLAWRLVDCPRAGGWAFIEIIVG